MSRIERRGRLPLRGQGGRVKTYGLFFRRDDPLRTSARALNDRFAAEIDARDPERRVSEVEAMWSSAAHGVMTWELFEQFGTASGIMRGVSAWALDRLGGAAIA